MGWIYEISNIENGKIYIGQTTQHNVATRWAEHFKSINSDSDTHLIRAFKSHGFEKFTFRVLHEISNNLLDEKEIEEIKNRNCLSPNGYNLRDGGSRGKHLPESIEKIRASHIGKTHTEDTKKKLRQINLGKKLELETKEKIRDKILGTKRTEEEIEKSSKSRTGLKRSDETRQRIRETHQIKVEQWSVEGTYMKTYESIKIAQEETMCNGISKCCKGIYKQSGGFIWKYKDIIQPSLNEEGDDT